MFLQKGLITPDQLDTALEQQRTSGQHLGEILVVNGWISRLDLAGALAEQWQGLPGQHRSAGEERPLRHLQVVPPADNEHTAPEAPFDLNGWLSQVQAELEQARPQEPVPATPLISFLAFAPTSKGYRLVECQGTSPALEDQLELPDCDGPLVVSRLTSSPLPLDTRPCAYLERAR